MSTYSCQEDCVEAQVVAHQSALIGFAYRIVGELETARDVVQDAFLKLAKDDCCGLENPRAWLYTVSRNLALQLLRRKKFVAEDVAADEVEWADEGAPLPGAGLEATEKYAGLRRLLPQLSPKQREVVELRYFQQLDFKAMAAITGDNTNNLYQTHYAALIRLRKLMESQTSP